MLFYSFRRVFGAASSEPQNVETESAESAGIPFSFHDLLILYLQCYICHICLSSSDYYEIFLCSFCDLSILYISGVIFVFHHPTNPFCKQHCHQGTLKSRFQSSTFCRFYASSYFDKVYIRIACSTLFINKISPILSRCSFLVKVRCLVSRESV